MAESLGDAVLHLRTDDSKLDAGIDEAKDKAEGVAAKFADVGSRVSDVGKKLTLGLTLPLTAFGVSAGKAASDAEELQAAFDTTFGALSGDMNQWAETTGNAMGRSTQEMQSAAQMFGLFFNQAAPTKQAAADLSKEFSQLGQDLASFHNADPDQVMQALRAGLSGESEPLRQFGVFLNDAAVGAKAMELGLAASTKELTDQDKIMARSVLIKEATVKAQGDVARTSGSTANQVRASKAAYEELQVTIGTKLLPVVTPLITNVASLLNWFTQLPAPVQTGVVAFLAMGAAFGPALAGIGGLIGGIGRFAPALAKLGPAFTIIKAGFAIMRVAALSALPALIPFLVPLGAIALAIGAVYLAWKNWDKIKPIIDGVGAAITGWWSANVQPILTAVGNKIKELVSIFEQYFGKQIRAVVTMISALMNGDFRGAWSAMQSIVATAINGALAVIRTFAPNIAKALQAIVQRMVSSGREIVQGLASGILAAREAVWNALKSVVLAGITRIRDFLGIRSPSLLFQEMGGYIAAGLALGIEGGIPAVKSAMAQLANVVADGTPRWGVDINGGPMKLPDGSGGGGTEPQAETETSWKEGFRNWFKDGIRAALDGDLGGFMKDWLASIADGMFDRALDTLANMVADALEAILGGLSGGGGSGGDLATMFSSIFAGGFSTGGKIPFGKFGIVGEKGPEPVIPVPGGAMIRPSSSMSSFASSLRPSAANINMPISIDATGADAAGLERVRQSLDRLRAELPSQIVETVQEAGDRRILSSGGWR